jgi:hypothetical protein
MSCQKLPGERRGFVLCWTASRRADWKVALVQRLEAAFPGEPICDDGGRLEQDPAWRQTLDEHADTARAILVVLESRALLRAQLQPVGYDCVDELVPRELQRVLGERTYLVIPLLLGGAEMPKLGELPSALRPLAVRKPIAVRPVPAEAPDFSVFECWVHEFAASGAAAIPSPPAPAVRPAVPAASAPPPARVVRNPWRILWLRCSHFGWPLAVLVLLLAAVLVFLASLAMREDDAKVENPAAAPSGRDFRVVSVPQAIALSPEAIAKGHDLLFGDFTVSGVEGLDAVLRPVDVAFRARVRVTIRFSNRGEIPKEGASIRWTAANAAVVRNVRRGTDGNWTIVVQHR